MTDKWDDWGKRLSLKYILDEHKLVVPVDTSTIEGMIRWGQWFEYTPNRIIKQETIGTDAWVSTVFIGTDLNFSMKGPPIVFETMIFPDDVWNYQDRCSTWEQALAMHAIACMHVRQVQRQLPMVIS